MFVSFCLIFSCAVAPYFALAFAHLSLSNPVFSFLCFPGFINFVVLAWYSGIPCWSIPMFQHSSIPASVSIMMIERLMIETILHKPKDFNIYFIFRNVLVQLLQMLTKGMNYTVSKSDTASRRGKNMEITHGQAGSHHNNSLQVISRHWNVNWKCIYISDLSLTVGKYCRTISNRI